MKRITRVIPVEDSSDHLLTRTVKLEEISHRPVDKLQKGKIMEQYAVKQTARYIASETGFR